ncbi:UNVERIFIED_CONTAM: protein ALTERED PHOSPHATE STARVATION RESPONSE 1 [Sesamum angustifolium]|uniref:Protein ALTERED PHOSPHATE STARVATION RESPONSE 1 n=1 Tax=Sesamum angustifolium TaxID=2727405 RepID=A0AAW2L4T0_9LAMI
MGESHLHISDSSSEDVDSEDFEHHHHIHHGHESEDDAHQHHNHHAHVHKGKGFDDEVRHSHNEEESSSHYPRGVFNGYGSGFGDGMVNDPNANPYPYPYPFPPPLRPYGEPYMDQWNPPGMPSGVQPWYYSSIRMCLHEEVGSARTKTVVHQPPADPALRVLRLYWNYPSWLWECRAPPPPSPKASTWDFFNPFDVYDNGYPGYYSSGRYGYASNSSSPDSTEVRGREGIPDLEEETDNEVYKEVLKGNRMKADARRSSGESTPGLEQCQCGKMAMLVWDQFHSITLRVVQDQCHCTEVRIAQDHCHHIKVRVVPDHCLLGVVRRVRNHLCHKNITGKMQSHQCRRDSISLTDEKSSSENIVLKSVDEGSVKKKGVTFEVGETSKQDADSSKLSSVTLLSPRGTRDLREVVAEIRDEFETASSYGKEVAMMLEVGKLPYQPSFLKVILSRILCLISPSVSLQDPPSMQSIKLASSTMKLAKSYFEDVGNDVNTQACNLSATLDKLYAWEKKLYKEVKDEEILRVAYEKQCKRLKTLDEEGAESSKIDATRASIRKLLTKLDVSIKAIDAISSRIHKLRDEELEPQVAALIHGLIRMWKAMLKCHQKQFQAIMESKMRKLRAKTDPLTDTSSRATTELERELRAWCERFNEWISSQKSYVESLNGWLLQCLQYEPEETPDGPVPYSPGRLGAPPIFIICNDWQQAMEAVSEARVANAMNTFATSLRQLWEKQDEEGRQRLKAEYLSKDYEKQLRAHLTERGKIKLEQDAMSDNTRLSVVPSDNGVSPLDDLKVDLDSIRQKLAEERIKHKDAMKLVHDAASSSLQGGLVPIFKALENFTSEALKAHEHVRLQHPEQSS